MAICWVTAFALSLTRLAHVLISPCYQYLDKRLFVQLNGSRKVIGVLRGYDVFLNIVLDEAVEERDGGEKVRLGMVVRTTTTNTARSRPVCSRHKLMWSSGHPR